MSRASQLPSPNEDVSKAVKTADRVVVRMTGSPSSVAAAAWAIQQGRLDTIVVYDERSGRPQVTESYVRAVASGLGLAFEETLEKAVAGASKPVLVVGAPLGEPVSSSAGVTLVRPLLGWSSDAALADLDGLRLRPHPAITLGLDDVCTDQELRAAADAADLSCLELAIAAGAVQGGVFPDGLAFFAEGEERHVPPAPSEEPTAGARRAKRTSLERGERWLFSYGSNGPDQLSERLGRTVEAQPASVTGWRLAFVGHSARWNGATATLVPAEASRRVRGSLSVLTDKELLVLDRHEGVPRSYDRRGILCLRGRKPVEAVVYIAASREEGTPSKEYLRAIEDHLRAVST